MNTLDIADLGWSAELAGTVDGLAGSPARVVGVHRSRIDVLSAAGAVSLPLFTEPLAVGDWVLVDDRQILALVPRSGLMQRRAAGGMRSSQLIAANVDALGIVSSCNADFSEARLERYLAIAAQAGAMPVVVLTKADQCDDPRAFQRRAERLSPLVTALALDARDPAEARRLDPWCRDGQVLALVGMSGVGKTTLQNALTGVEQATAGIREDDARGRHTTTARAMRRTLAGGWLIDTPGMRELGLADAAEGIGEVFSDIGEIADQCRFRDCAHEGEPGCAVAAAIDAGDLDADRVMRWRKLLIEDRIGSESIAETRARQKGRQKMYNQGKKRGRWKRDDQG